MERTPNHADAVHVVGVAIAHEDGELNADGVRWMRRGDARSRCGVGKDILDQWVSDGKVEAHKLHPGKNGTVIFSADDIERAIRESPRYAPEKLFKKSVTSPIA